MIKERIKGVLKEIDSRARLVVAVKYANEEQIKSIVDLGIDIGFNTFQQFEEISKKNDLSKVGTHFIGHIQSNKISKIISLRPFLIQSVSSFEVAEKINSVCKNLGVKQKILLQINSDSEKSDGFKFDELEKEIGRIKNLSNIEVCGMMTIPPSLESIGDDEIKKIYRKMKLEYDKFNFEFLSMGMSNDYFIAIEEGANIVRVGRKIFE